MMYNNNDTMKFFYFIDNKLNLYPKWIALDIIDKLKIM